MCGIASLALEQMHCIPSAGQHKQFSEVDQVHRVFEATSIILAYSFASCKANCLKMLCMSMLLSMSSVISCPDILLLLKYANECAYAY